MHLKAKLPFGRAVVVEVVVVWIVVKAPFAGSVMFESGTTVVGGVVISMDVKSVLGKIGVLEDGSVVGEILVIFTFLTNDLADESLLFNDLGPNFLCLIESKSNLLDFSSSLGMLMDLEGDFCLSIDFSFVASIALELTTNG